MFLAAKAKVVIDAYQKVQVKRQMSQRRIEGRKLQEWTPPPSNCIKVNVDTVVHKDQQTKDQQTASLGAVIRNSLAGPLNYIWSIRQVVLISFS